MTDTLAVRMRLRERYDAHCQECRRKREYHMTYEEWLASELIAAEARIIELETFDSPVTLVEHAQMKARIEAAARIEANVTATGAIVDYAFSNGWNQCREQFRRALGVEP